MFSSGLASPESACAKFTNRIASSSLGEIGCEQSPLQTSSSDVANSLNATLLHLGGFCKAFGQPKRKAGYLNKLLVYLWRSYNIMAFA